MSKDKTPSPQTNVTGISRELMGKIVDEVFDGAIEDARVIEEIYAVIKRHEAPHKPLLTCQCENSKTDPCIVCGKGKTLVTAEWLQKMAAREGDHDATTGTPSPQTREVGSS
jgi:hypothetical protein